MRRPRHAWKPTRGARNRPDLEHPRLSLLVSPPPPPIPRRVLTPTNSWISTGSTRPSWRLKTPQRPPRPRRKLQSLDLKEPLSCRACPSLTNLRPNTNSSRPPPNSRHKKSKQRALPKATSLTEAPGSRGFLTRPPPPDPRIRPRRG